MAQFLRYPMTTEKTRRLTLKNIIAAEERAEEKRRSTSEIWTDLRACTMIDPHDANRREKLIEELRRNGAQIWSSY